jgi:hypothetical protein
MEANAKVWLVATGRRAVGVACPRASEDNAVIIVVNKS